MLKTTYKNKQNYFIQLRHLHLAKATTFKNHHFRVGGNGLSDSKDFIYIYIYFFFKLEESITLVILCPTFYFIYSNFNEW